MRVFLTGGTGYIGIPLATAMRARGWDLTVLVRDPADSRARGLADIGVELVAGDVTDRETIRDGMSGSDMVVHNAGHYEFGVDRAGQDRMRAVNVVGTDNVLGLAHELAIRRAVYVSTVQAFGDSGWTSRDETFTRQTPCRTTYERTKTEAHEVALGYARRGLPLITVCPNAVVGPNDHSAFGYFIRLYINRAMPPLCWSPDAINAPVFLEDLVEGIVLAAEKGRVGEPYNLCGEPRTLREHLACWIQRPGGYKPLVWLGAGAASLLFAPLEPFERWLGLPAFISRETVTSSSINWHYSSLKAKRELGWTFRAADQMWLDTIDGELELLAQRAGQSLLERLKPLVAPR